MFFFFQMMFEWFLLFLLYCGSFLGLFSSLLFGLIFSETKSSGTVLAAVFLFIYVCMFCLGIAACRMACIYSETCCKVENTENGIRTTPAQYDYQDNISAANAINRLLEESRRSIKERSQLLQKQIDLEQRLVHLNQESRQDTFKNDPPPAYEHVTEKNITHI